MARPQSTLLTVGAPQLRGRPALGPKEPLDKLPAPVAVAHTQTKPAKEKVMTANIKELKATLKTAQGELKAATKVSTDLTKAYDKGVKDRTKAFNDGEKALAKEHGTALKEAVKNVTTAEKAVAKAQAELDKVAVAA